MQQRATEIKFLSNNDRQILLHKFSHTVKQTVCVFFYVLQRKKILRWKLRRKKNSLQIFFFFGTLFLLLLTTVCVPCHMLVNHDEPVYAFRSLSSDGEDPGSRFGIWIPSKKKRKIESLKKKMEDRV